MRKNGPPWPRSECIPRKHWLPVLDSAPNRRCISLRGVEVHNLKQVDLDLPYRQLIVFCGVSGSGKTSLALDTLYAEGQRRYIESFSAYTRQFLEPMSRPEAERIDGIPPSIAVTPKNRGASPRSTVATATETYDYLRLLYARTGVVMCPDCDREVRRDTPETAARELLSLPAELRYLLVFPLPPNLAAEQGIYPRLRKSGFSRVLAAGRLWKLEPGEPAAFDPAQLANPGKSTTAAVDVVVDRLTAGKADEGRLRDSLETAFSAGESFAAALIEDGPQLPSAFVSLPPVEVDGRKFRRLEWSAALRCSSCRRAFIEPQPQLFSFNHAQGACPHCEGFGNTLELDPELIVPDAEKTLRDGAIAPWNAPSYRHELEELLALAGDYDIPVDLPYRELDERSRRLVQTGVPERKFGGLDGFFHWLERRKYKVQQRAYLNRFKSERVCPACHGCRLRPEALAVRLGGKNIAETCALRVDRAMEFFRDLPWSDYQRNLARTMLEQVNTRLGYLCDVGLGYLTLDRPQRTLSGGEAGRVALTSAMGSSLVNMLYVLDEPSAGLHAADSQRLLHTVEKLRNRGNTVAVVEHDEAFLRAADMLVELGPAAGDRGGEIVYQGPPSQIDQAAGSTTGDFLSGRRGLSLPAQRREPTHGWIQLRGARGHNLQNISVRFPLGVLCVVTGVSGSGKSTLVQQTLYPALAARMNIDAEKPLAYDDVTGEGQLNNLVAVDQTPITRSARSNPVTYVKAFDEIRSVFAATADARVHNYTAAHFSFNVDKGRCMACSGLGFQEIDLQFLPDVTMRCPECRGQRYRPEILAIRYRQKSIADVLEMTVREAFGFFRGQRKVQARLKQLMDVGLDYVRLGQSASTLSGGEASRLKLAAYLASGTTGRCLFVLDEPTTGLHFADITQLLDCFEALLTAGHSLIVVEHNLQLIRAADYVIDLGPGAGEEGGRIVAEGAPDEIAGCESSLTGHFLRRGDWSCSPSAGGL